MRERRTRRSRQAEAIGEAVRLLAIRTGSHADNFTELAYAFTEILGPRGGRIGQYVNVAVYLSPDTLDRIHEGFQLFNRLLGTAGASTPANLGQFIAGTALAQVNVMLGMDHERLGKKLMFYLPDACLAAGKRLRNSIVLKLIDAAEEKKPAHERAMDVVRVIQQAIEYDDPVLRLTGLAAFATMDWQLIQGPVDQLTDELDPERDRELADALTNAMADLSHAVDEAQGRWRAFSTLLEFS